MKAHITIGLPASGKSTRAREIAAQTPGTVIVNNDTIRNTIYDGLGHRNWSHQVEEEVRTVREQQIIAAAQAGLDVVVDNTHMNPRTFQQIKDFCAGLKYEVEILDFRHVSVDECVARDAARTGAECVGEKVIRDMYQKFGRRRAINGQLPRWIKVDGRFNAIIVDLDGTLAEMQGRGPYDELRVGEDLVREHVLLAVQGIVATGAVLIFMSGRTDACRAQTIQWLDEKCGFAPGTYLLFMRAQGDHRRDSVVKLELYQQHVADRYSIIAVFDDRASVIRECWAPLGLPVFRCGPQDLDDF